MWIRPGKASIEGTSRAFSSRSFYPNTLCFTTNESKRGHYDPYYWNRSEDLGGGDSIFFSRPKQFENKNCSLFKLLVSILYSSKAMSLSNKLSFYYHWNKTSWTDILIHNHLNKYSYLTEVHIQREGKKSLLLFQRIAKFLISR